MKKYLHRKLFLWLLCCCRLYSADAQVFLNYAKDTSKIFYTGQSNFTISGKRITVSDSNHYALSDPYNRAGDAIFLNDCHNVTISNCILGPTKGGRGIYLQSCDSITITNCIFLDNEAAIITWGSSKVKVYNNQFINVQNEIYRLGTPCLSRALTSPYDLPAPPANGRAGAFVQLRIPSGGGNLISNNVGENILGFSCPEDLINVSHGPFDWDRPLVIANNQFRGGGPSGSGGGINIGDDLGPIPTYAGTANVIVYNNKLVDPGQYGIGVNNGTNILVDHNQVFGRSQRFTNVGMVGGDSYSHGSTYCNTVSFTNNSVNYIGRWPLGSSSEAPNPFQSDFSCGLDYNTIWFSSGNDFASSIDETIIPERLLAPFPVARLKFDNNLLDNSGSGLNATAYGGAAVVCDVNRKAATFNGTSSDVMTLPKSVWLEPSTQMISVSAWIKPSDLTLVRGFIRSQNADGWSDGWRGVVGNGTTYFTPVVNTSNGRAAVDCDGIVLNAWNFVAFTYDGKTLKGYINGVLKNSTVLEGSIVYNTNSNLAIGGSEGTYNFEGLIGDVSIYNGIRTASELLAEYYEVSAEFDGTTNNPNMPITATYYANSNSKVLYGFDYVKSDSYGTISASAPGATSYTWTFVGGNPNYEYSFGADQYVSVPDGGYASFEIVASPGYCMLPGRSAYTIYGDYWQLFKVKLLPGNEILVSKPAPEPPPANIPAARIRPVPKGVYTVRVTNMLGQLIKSGLMTDGRLQLDISKAIPGVYVVSVSNSRGVVYSEKIIKP